MIVIPKNQDGTTTYRRKRPVIVKVCQFDPAKHPWPAGVIPWSQRGVYPRDMSYGFIETRNGKRHVMEGDYIITDEEGERFPCRPDVFLQIYEPVE